MAFPRRRRQVDRPAESPRTGTALSVTPGSTDAAETATTGKKSTRRRVVRVLVLILVLGGLFSLKKFWWPPAFRSLAEGELRQGHVDEALAWLAYVDWLVPADSTTTLLRARAYRKLGEMGRVRELLSEADREGATDEELRRERILAFAQSGQMRKAESHLGGFLRDPKEDLDDVCEAFVIGYMRNQRFSEALSLLEAWTEDSPDLAVPFLLRGKLLSFRDDYEKSGVDLRRALELDPELDEARLELALLAIDQNRFEEAIPLLEECLDTSKLRPQAMVKLAVCWKATGEGERALAQLQSARAEFPDDPQVLLELGRIQFENGDYESAIETLERAVEINPLHDEIRYMLAQSLSLAGRPDEAAPHFEYVDQARDAMSRIDLLNRAVMQNPKDVETLVQLGKLFLEVSRDDEGVVRLLSALDLDPDNQEAHRLLFEYYSSRIPSDPAFQALADEHRRQLSQP